ncbi:unnamed protein product [Cylicocyclus nassatus]|uniref:Uncharacterized protein n=1 Tax=Cylicocyclus nassatus TaxID=53992 RepID=A0AA36GND3_CYLNA|nr:unnamed protein product [Cylicocyclus nassatus]
MEDVPGESKPFVLVILPYAMHCRLDQKLCIGLRDGKVSSEEGDIVSLVLQASLFSSLKQFDRPPMDNDEGLCGYQGLAEDVKNFLIKLNEKQRHKVIKYWHGFRRSGSDFIVLAHCDSYKATATLGRLINQSIAHANLDLRCIRFGERRVRCLHCLVAKAISRLVSSYCGTMGEGREIQTYLAFQTIIRVYVKDVFPDPAMFLVKVASPLPQLQIATEAAFKHMESIVHILYRKRKDPKPLVILLGARHLEESGHRFGCCVAVVGEEVYAVECQAEARANEMPLHWSCYKLAHIPVIFHH